MQIMLRRQRSKYNVAAREAEEDPEEADQSPGANSGHTTDNPACAGHVEAYHQEWVFTCQQREARTSSMQSSLMREELLIKKEGESDFIIGAIKSGIASDNSERIGWEDFLARKVSQEAQQASDAAIRLASFR